MCQELVFKIFVITGGISAAICRGLSQKFRAQDIGAGRVGQVTKVELIAATLGGILPGAFFAIAAASMASAISTQEAFLRGTIVGGLVGFSVGLLVLLLIRFFGGPQLHGRT